ncbi:serine hydrolase [Thermodesulfobacteriota bacterium]
MVSALADLKVWVKALAAGRLLSERMHKEQLRTIPNPASKGAGYGLGVNSYKGWLGHSGGVAGSMCNVYINPKADVVIIHYFNKLDPLNEKQNATDLKALSDLLLEMMRITCPDTM